MLLVFLLFGCSLNQTAENIKAKEDIADIKRNMKTVNLEINGYCFSVTLAQSEAADKLYEILENEELVLELDDYGGFEKVGSLGFELPREDENTSTFPGDIVLYNGNNIVIFYGTNNWSYTRLGKIDDIENLNEALNENRVTVKFSKVV